MRCSAAPVAAASFTGANGTTTRRDAAILATAMAIGSARATAVITCRTILVITPAEKRRVPIMLVARPSRRPRPSRGNRDPPRPAAPPGQLRTPDKLGSRKQPARKLVRPIAAARRRAARSPASRMSDRTARISGRAITVPRNARRRRSSTSIMASAKANQVEPFAYVCDLLIQLSRNTSPAVAALLPDTWLATHSEARRCWSR